LIVPDPLNRIAVATEVPEQVLRAAQLAERLGVPLAEEGSSSDFLLIYTAQHLELQKIGSRMGGVYADFVTGRAAHRLRYGGGRGQLIARAVGLKKGETPAILDLTAGLGRDAFVLASLGCVVTLVERSSIVAALLRDGLERALGDSTTAGVVQRMGLEEVDAGDYLRQLGRQIAPAVCYLDPMYPHTKKSALPGKEMRLFREVVGEDLDAAAVLNHARQVATKRVVVKRPRKAKCLIAEKPDFQIIGKSTRYDIYLTANESK
jgi:16S rRNA (guanine1516-N2)-methyltransferase